MVRNIRSNLSHAGQTFGSGETTAVLSWYMGCQTMSWDGMLSGPLVQYSKSQTLLAFLWLEIYTVPCLVRLFQNARGASNPPPVMQTSSEPPPPYSQSAGQTRQEKFPPGHDDLLKRQDVG